jgi:hypothetical protein
MTTNGAWVDGVFYDGIAVTAADLNANNQWLLAQAGSGAPPTAAPNVVFAGPASGGSGSASFRALVPADIPGGGGGSGTVTSVALSAPAEFVVAGSPITTAGTLALSKSSQAANSVWAGPVGGVGGPPGFRALVAADLPGGGAGTVTSVALTAPADFIVSGSPVTGAGSLGLTYANESAHAFHAGPASGAAAPPTWRAILAADIPALPYVASVGLSASPEFTVGGSPVTGSGTLSFSANAQGAHTVWAGPTGSTGSPGFRLLVPGDIPALSYVTSVGLVLPAIFTVTGSPVIAAGTLTATLATQSANFVWAGPTTGSPGAPTFRALVAADLPGGGVGTVTSVGLALPSIFNVTNSPVTGSGTLTGALATQTAGLVFASPATGVAAAPTFRALATTDIPALSYVTSVAQTVPPEFIVGGSPVTGAGTLVITKATQPANTVWAGPLSGGSVAPTFRALVGADLPLPSATTLGGVQSIAAVAHNFLTGISITGIPSASQPAFTDILGTATAGQGGTGAANLTAHGMVIAEGASPMVTIPPGAGGQLVISQGATSDPAFEPMSGDATITAAGLITVTKTGGVALGTYATQNFATPPIIGGTTPNAASFTTLAASSTVSGAGFTALFASPPAIGGTTPAAGTFSTLTSAGFINGLNLTTTGGSGIAATGNGGTTGLLVINDSATTTQASLFINATAAGGGAGIRMVGNGATTPSKTIRVHNGNLEVVADGYAPQIFTLTDAGALSVAGASAGVTAPIITATGTGGLNGQNVSTTTNGSATAPSVSVGAQGIGLYSNGANLLGFTNTPTAGQQPVNMIANGVLAFGSTTALRVGVANTNLAALQIIGGTTYSGLNISRWDASNTACTIALGKSRSATIGTIGGALTSGTNIGQITFVGDDGVTFNTVAANIFVQCNGTVSAGVIPCAMVFSTQQGANDFTMSAGSFYAQGNTGGKLLFDNTGWSYMWQAPVFQQPTPPTTGQTVTLANNTSGSFIIPAGTLATLTVAMPPAPKDQQEITVVIATAITALTVSGNGNSLGPGMPTGAQIAGFFFRTKFNNTTSTWYRIG